MTIAARLKPEEMLAWLDRKAPPRVRDPVTRRVPLWQPWREWFVWQHDIDPPTYLGTTSARTGPDGVGGAAVRVRSVSGPAGHEGAPRR